MPGYATALRNTRMTDVLNAIDAGGAAGQILLYTAPRPATGGAVGAATLLAQNAFSFPCAAAPAGGVLTFSAITDDPAANNTGTAVWARITTSAGAFVADVSASVAGGGGELQITGTAAIVTGQPVHYVSLTDTEGNP